MGKHLSIDETLLHEDLRTFLTNKDGHGKHGTLIASVSGTKASDVIEILMMLPEKKRLEVEEVTMDFSDSMYAIVSAVFPNAMITIDCFHIIKRCTEAVEEIRLKAKREAIKAQKKEKAEFKKKLEKRTKQRRYYRKRHPKTYKGRKRGRKPMRLNRSFKPEESPMEIQRWSCLQEAAICFCRVVTSGARSSRSAQIYSSAFILR